MAEIRLTGKKRQVGQRKHVGEILETRQCGIEQVGRRSCRGRSVGRCASTEIDPGLKNRLGILLFYKNESSGQRIVRDALESDVSDRGAEYDCLDVALVQHAASHV